MLAHPSIGFIKCALWPRISDTTTICIRHQGKTHSSRERKTYTIHIHSRAGMRATLVNLQVLRLVRSVLATRGYGYQRNKWNAKSGTWATSNSLPFRFSGNTTGSVPYPTTFTRHRAGMRATLVNLRMYASLGVCCQLLEVTVISETS